MSDALRLFAASCLLLLVGLVPARAAEPDVVPPGPAGPVYIVTYIDVAANGVPPALAALRQYRDAARAETANMGVDLFQEAGQTNRLLVVETWREQPDFDRHAAAASSTRLAAALRPLLLAPPDIRHHRSYNMAPRRAGAPNTGALVVAHLDVAPPLFARMVPALPAYVDASRREAGNARFDLLQQVAPRQNHITVIEAWSGNPALDAHRTAAHTRGFRDQLHPLLGALHDERVYRPIN